jgi:hypothetical protein
MICSNATTIREYLDGGRAAIMQVMDRGRVGADDVLFLRRNIFNDDIVTQEEASALFALERTAADKAPEWTPLFVEAITAFVVWQTRPTGIISDSKAEWLIEKVDGAKTLNALAALVNVMAEAHRVPEWFRAAARARASRGWPGAAEALAAADAETAMAA